MDKMMDGGGAATAAPPLFRPQAVEQADLGQAFDFEIPSWRSVGLLALATLALAAAFAGLANFNRSIRAEGRVAPLSGISRILAPHSGIVEQVRRPQGATVDAGTPLLKIVPGMATEQGLSPSAVQAGIYRQQQQLSRAASTAERLRQSERLAQLGEEQRRLTGAAASLARQMQLQRQRIAQREQRLAAMAPARAKGFVSEIAIQREQEALLELQQQLAALSLRHAETGHLLAQTESQKRQLAAEVREGEFRAADSVAALERGAAGAEAGAGWIVTAPRSGRITGLHVRPGESVRAGQELATVAPAGRRDLGIEIFVPAASAGGLRRGQRVTLRFHAFPYQRYGTGRAVVRSVSETALSSPGTGVPAYRVLAVLEDGAGGPPLSALRIDMSLTASIVVERRSLLDWLLAPIRRAREPVT